MEKNANVTVYVHLTKKDTLKPLKENGENLMKKKSQIRSYRIRETCDEFVTEC